MQLFTLHPGFCKLNYHIKPEENVPEEVKKLKEKMDHCGKLRNKHKVPWWRITDIVGISRSNYYRLQSKIKNKGWDALAKQSRRPKRVRQSKIPALYVQHILEIRQQNMTYGKDKIAVILLRDYGIKLSASSVGRILRKLRIAGKIQHSETFCCRKRRRKFDRHAKRWQYGKHIPLRPGQMVQIDHMSVTKNQLHMKHFQAWDPVSKYVNAEIYSSATSRSAKAFLIKLVTESPFSITSIQVDGGSEFMAEFEQEAQKLGITLYILPPKCPQYNGGVERTNRTFREEFYARKDVLADSLGEMKYELCKAVKTYNTYRPHKSLDFLTPVDYINSLMRSLQSNM